MNITDLFIKRPVMTTLVMASILIFGITGYRLLPVSDLPNVDFPTILVTASLPGASPETMASAVATPLERQFSTIAGIDTMNSSSSQGITTITIQFELSRNIDAAAQDIQAAIAKTQPQLPQDMLPPSYQKVNPADQPIQYYALTSPTLPLSTLDEYGETFLAQRISMVDGVAQVLVYGSQKYAVRIQLDPMKLATKGIGLADVATAVSDANVNLPTGTLWGRNTAYTIEANGQLQDAKAYRPLIVSYQNGNPVRLQDLGEVLDSVQSDKVAAWYRDTRSVVLAIQRQPGTNTVEVAASVKQLVERLKPQLPASVNTEILYDRSVSIHNSVNDVKVTLFIALILVILVIFLFLRNFRATIIPSMALPMSIVGTFAVMYVLGFNMDNLSLMALTLSVGFVVDDAIVMLENIVRHMEMGKPPLQAALDGAREIGFTILSMTVSLVAVFIPLLFMSGIIGRLFREFAVTISAAILVSGIVSLTLTPMLASRFLRPSKEEHHGRVFDWSERIWDRTAGFYERTLAGVMRHRPWMVAFSVLILAGTVVLAMLVPKGFLPTEDTGQIFGVTEAAEGTSFDSMVKHQQGIMDVLLKDPNIEGFMSAVGAGGPTSIGNQGRVFMQLKPRSERALSANEVVAELRPKLSQVVGMRVFLQVPPTIRIGGMLTKAEYQFTMQATDTDLLYSLVPKFQEAVKKLPGLLDVTSDLQIKNPHVMVDIDRDKATSLGISAKAVENALYYAFGSRQISTIYTPSNQYWVIQELQPQYQRGPAALNLLYMRSPSGNQVPLASLAQLRPDLGPLTINHYGQLPAVTISFDLKPDVSIGDAVSRIQELARQTLPSTVTTTFAGTAQAFKSSQSDLGVLLILAIFVIYIILGILYESFIHPITILTGLPFAGFGALLTLFLFRSELNVYSFVGIIMLIGVVKKNAIMMIDFAVGAEEEGLSAHDAIMKAASIRFRPIMMTTVSAFMGTLPIAIGLGAGAESRRPLGLAVVGGLLFSQIITLYVTPVFYTYFDRLQTRIAGAMGRQVEKK